MKVENKKFVEIQMDCDCSVLSESDYKIIPHTHFPHYGVHDHINQ